MTEVYLHACSVLAPGLSDWNQTQAVLTGVQTYQADDLPAFPKHLLPPNERRRATATMKLVLQVAANIVEQYEELAHSLHSVFASSTGDSDVIHRICTALTLPERPVSPTHFHNSVHNAPAGYWSISAHCQQPYTAVSAFDASFSAGLLEAVITATIEQAPVLLVAYDRPLPEPLSAVRNIHAPFAVALLLSTQAQIKSRPSLAKLKLQIASSAQEVTRMSDKALEQLRCGNPAARSLPLLSTLARGIDNMLILPYLDNTLLQLDVKSTKDT